MSNTNDEQNTAGSNDQTPQQPSTGAVSTLCKSPPSACFRSTYVTIEIGPRKKAFVMHKDLLTFYSDYFWRAFNGSFKEATESKISLPDEREDVFEIFNKFIYSRSLADEENLTWRTLVALWLFGDKYLTPALQNSAMDALAKRKACPSKYIGNIWTKTLPNSPLRKYILELTVYTRCIARFRPYGQLWSHEALVDLLEAYANREDTIGYTFPPRGKCYYHVHNEGERC